MECFRLLFGTILCDHQFFSSIRDSMKAGSLWGMMRGVRGVRMSIDLSWLAKGVRVMFRVTILRFKQDSGRDSVGRGQHFSNRVSGISTRTMHQSTTTSLSQTIWPRWASRQFLSVPVTFGYSLSSEAVVIRQLRRWKRLWRRSLTRSHKRTSMGPSRIFWNGTTSALEPDEVTSKRTRVSYVYYQ